MHVSTIVVSYNTRELTRECLTSVYDKTNGVDFEVIVVDNGSTDGSADMVTEFFPNAILIKSDRNLGFGPANNLAIRRASGKYVFLLNPDTALLNNAMRIFFDFMEDGGQQQVGAVGGYLLDGEGRAQHSYGEFVTVRDIYRFDTPRLVRRKLRQGLRSVLGPGLASQLAARLPKRKAVGSATQRTDAATQPAPAIKRVDYVTGADLFLRGSVLHEIGVFDERYFLYAEEMDLQYRMCRAGYTRLVIAGPRIVHHLSRSLYRAEKGRLQEAAKRTFLSKHFPVRYALCRLASGLTGQPRQPVTR